MRYFVHTKSNTTLAAPDNVSADLVNLCDEVGWSWYLSQVKQNAEARIFPEDHDVDDMLFIHAKYYDKEYQEIDRITSNIVEYRAMRHHGNSLGV